MVSLPSSDGEDEPAPTREEVRGALSRIRVMLENGKHRKTAALTFWQERQSFAILHPLARQLLSLVASSAAVERAFSGTAFITDGRDTLGVASLEKQALIRDYMLQPDYELSILQKAISQVKL